MTNYYNIAYYWNDIYDYQTVEFKNYLQNKFVILKDKVFTVGCMKINPNSDIIDIFVRTEPDNLLNHFTIDRESNIYLIHKNQ